MHYKHLGIIKLDIYSIITISSYIRNLEFDITDRLLEKKVEILKALSRSMRIRILISTEKWREVQL